MIFHKPALLQEVLNYLNPKAGGTYIDATAGGGGHTREILKTGAKVLAIDRDEEAIQYLSKNLKPEFGEKLVLSNGNFSKISQIAQSFDISGVDGILIDLGVSSYQLETAQRGFSFQKEGPLDMRMDKTITIKAENIINDFDERRLYEIFKNYGQEKYSRSIARAIISARSLEPIKTTGQLARIVQETIPRSVGVKSRIHEATRVFQAIRIIVNSELLNLEECLPQTVSLLKVGGRLGVISFHSLEDAIVKRFFKGNQNLKVLTESPIGPTAREIDINKRARSAKLRVSEKIG